ncbi:MAG: hypothetical protein MUF40_03110 [Gemmatimonadaceae bacterium]|nr:hypothetical protein [Gemmatimonadaceae bacterium]
MTAVVPIGVADAAASATAPHHPLQWRRRIVPIALAAVALIVLLVALGSGAMAIPVPRVLEILLGGDTAGALDATIVRSGRRSRWQGPRCRCSSAIPSPTRHWWGSPRAPRSPRPSR